MPIEVATMKGTFSLLIFVFRVYVIVQVSQALEGQSPRCTIPKMTVIRSDLVYLNHV